MAEMVLELVLELRPQEREWSPRDVREMISHDRNASAPAKILYLHDQSGDGNCRER